MIRAGFGTAAEEAVILIGVHTDRPASVTNGVIKRSFAGGTGSGEDHIRPVIHHHFSILSRKISVKEITGVVHQCARVGVCALGAVAVPLCEGGNGRDFHPANGGDGISARHARRQPACQVGGFFRGKHHPAQVVRRRVDS